MALSWSERAAVESHVGELSRFLDLSRPFELRGQILTNAQAHGAMIAGILMKRGTRPDQSMSDQLTEDYLDAIEDLPAWAVRETIRKWNRGESVPLDRKPHDFSWRPEPATLARLTRIEVGSVKWAVKQLNRLLGCEVAPEYSDQHREIMRARLANVMPRIVSFGSSTTQDQT